MDTFDSVYQSLFETDFFARAFMEIPCGASFIQVLYDAEKKPIDYITLEMNPFLLKLLHAKKEDVIGRKASSQLSTNELHHWLDLFSRVAEVSGNTSHSKFTTVRGRIYTVTALCPKAEYVCLFFAEESEKP